MKMSRCARRDNLLNSFFRCPSALNLIFIKLFNVSANKLYLSSYFAVLFNFVQHNIISTLMKILKILYFLNIFIKSILLNIFSTQKNTVIPLLTTGGQSVESFTQYKYLETVVQNTELSDDKDIQRQLRYQCCAANKLRASFPDVPAQWKVWLFVPSAHPCMHHNQGRRQRGASGARPPHLKSVPPLFTFGSLVAAYIQCNIF